jgi:hypothetical protein
LKKHGSMSLGMGNWQLDLTITKVSDSKVLGSGFTIQGLRVTWCGVRVSPYTLFLAFDAQRATRNPEPLNPEPYF